MGLQQNTSATFVSVSEGQFIIPVEKGKHNNEKKDKDTGVVKYGLAANGFSGVLTNITIEDSRFGKQYHFHWQDEDTGEEYKMPMKIGSNLAYSFLNALAGAAAKGRIGLLKLYAKARPFNQKIYTNIFVSDTDGRINWKYDWKKDIPAIEQTTNHRGETINDDKARYEFFAQVLQNEIVPALRDGWNPTSVQAPTPPQGTNNLSASAPALPPQQNGNRAEQVTSLAEKKQYSKDDVKLYCLQIFGITITKQRDFDTLTEEQFKRLMTSLREQTLAEEVLTAEDAKNEIPF